MRCHGGLGLSLLLYFSVDQLTKRHADTQFIELAWPTNKRQFLLLNVCRSGSRFGNKQRKKTNEHRESESVVWAKYVHTNTAFDSSFSLLSVQLHRNRHRVAGSSISNSNCRSACTADMMYEAPPVCPCQLYRRQFHLSLQSSPDLWSWNCTPVYMLFQLGPICPQWGRLIIKNHWELKKHGDEKCA